MVMTPAPVPAAERQHLVEDEGHDAAKDVAGRHLYRGDAAHVEQRESERRFQVTGLKVDRDHDRHPGGVQRAAAEHRADDGDVAIYLWEGFTLQVESGTEKHTL